MINLMNLFGGGQMGTSLFGAPKMFNDMPDPGIPNTGGPDGVAPPKPLLADMPAMGATPMGLAGQDGGGFNVPPPPAPESVNTQNPLAPIPPSAASQLPPPRSDQGTPGAAPLPPPSFGGLPTMAEGGVGPDMPVAAGPNTTGGTTPSANTAPAAAEGEKKNTLKDFLERAGQVKFGDGSGGGVKPANIGSAGQPHIPQGASALFQSIMDAHQKTTPMPGKVPDMSAIMQRLGLR